MNIINSVISVHHTKNLWKVYGILRPTVDHQSKWKKKEEEAIFGPDYLFRYWDCRKAIRSSYIGYGKGTNWGNKNKNDFCWTGSGNMIAMFMFEILSIHYHIHLGNYLFTDLRNHLDKESDNLAKKKFIEI